MAKQGSPLLWFQSKYCKACKDKTCQKKSAGVYALGEDWQAKIPCLLSLLLMTETERTTAREYRK